VFKTSLISILETVMKSFISTIAAAATPATIALGSTSANAADGTITFTGAVTDATCSIDAKAVGAADKNVTLPTVTSSTLGSKDSTAGTTAATDLTFALSGCSTETKAVARFENGPTIDQTTGYLANQAPAGAQNVQVRLLKGALTVKWGSGPVEQCRISYTLPKKDPKAYNPGYLSLQSHCVPGSEAVASSRAGAGNTTSGM